MVNRIVALVLIICCMFSAIPVKALVEDAAEIENGYFEAEVPEADGDSGVEGLFIETEDGSSADEAESAETVVPGPAEDEADIELPLDGTVGAETAEGPVVTLPGNSLTADAETVVPGPAEDEADIELPLDGAVGEETAEGPVVTLPGNSVTAFTEYPADNATDESGNIVTDAAAIPMPEVYSAADTAGEAPGIVLDRYEARMIPGSRLSLNAAYADGSGGEIAWRSDAPGIVAVDEKGMITALECGTATVTAADAYGAQALCLITVSETIESITFERDTIYLGVGENSGVVGIKVNDGSIGGFKDYTLKSSKTKYVRVNDDGTLTGRKKGSATITLTGPGGITDTVKVVVKKAPSKITASPKSVTIGLGETAQLGYKLSSGSKGSVTYKSLNEAYVSVDSDTGVITGIATGEGKVRIRTYNKKSCTVKVKVVNAPETVTLSETELVMGAEQKLTLKATVNKGSASKIRWSSDDTSVVTVKDGKLTAVAPGTAVITAATYVEGVFARCAVTVKPAPTAVTLPKSKIYIGVGEKVQLEPDVGDTVGGFKYSSSKKKYASVSSSGVIKGKKKGTTTITVKTYNGKKTTMKVVVGIAPKKIKAKDAVLGLNETGTIKYSLTSGSYGAVKFTSLSPECVSVDPDTGSIRALNTGTATIQLETYNKKKDTATIEVLNAPERIDMSDSQQIIGVGQSVQLSAQVNDGAAGAITWESSDSGVVTVKNGKITGKAEGTAAVKARTYVDGVEGICNVLVKPAPQKVTLPSKKVYIGVGDSYLIEPDVGDSVGGYKYSSSAKKYAKVSSDGVVKGVKAGTAKITVKTYNNKKATLTVVVRKAPSKITPTIKSIELGVGETFKAGYKLPKKTMTTVTFAGMDENILKVDSRTGEVTAIKIGEAQVRMRTHNGKEAFTTVNVYPAPEWVKVNCDRLDMGIEQTFALSVSIPEESRSAIRYTSSDANVAKVSSEGVVTAVAKGNAVIRVTTCAPAVFAEIPVKVWDAPSGVMIDNSQTVIDVDTSMQIVPVIPEGTMTAFTYKSSDTSIARVSADGIVTGRMRGNVTITVTTHNKKCAGLALTINDPWYPEGVSLDNKPGVMWAGGEPYQLRYTVTPSHARPLMKWSSSEPEVASIDQNGLITPLGYGYTTIRGVSEKNSEAEIKFTLAVQEEDRILVIPERTTDEAGISANLAKIDDIRASAIAQVDALRAKGTIKAKDASKRKSMINNIFRDYAFAWKTPSLQRYWRKANSEGGVKDFKADRVYYGMPYISGSGDNRVYNASKALKENRYTASGNGYYLLNKKKLLNGKYVGSDCSGLVNMAIWGTNSSHTRDRTVEIAESKSYKTIKSFNKMRPGDLICLGYNHVVMFLYYADKDKDKIMIIENGGGEAGTNTVHCAVHNVSYYKKRGYKVRRLASLG